LDKPIDSDGADVPDGSDDLNGPDDIDGPNNPDGHDDPNRPNDSDKYDVLLLKWLKSQEGGLNWLVKNLGYLCKLKTTFD